ncbi:MAG: serine/threonine-protein kinase [Planctomycetota bacterium]|nr:serine/threonine-protein kinase [Planctomycetota bacterium]
MTITLAPPRPGQTLLLHVEHAEVELPGSYREYEVETRIAEGNFGEVYRAREKLSGQEVALKILKREWLTDAQAVARFRREAEVLARLTHANVIRVYNFGRYGPSFFMALELMDGPTLEARMAERGIWPVGEALAHGIAVLRGLEAVHAAGIVHRDVKPSNVACLEGRLVIFDFGLAIGQDMSRLTLSGSFLGTPQYAAPEQAVGQPTTGASDVYAAGVILYQLLSGRLPHEADSVFGILHKKADEDPVPLAEHRADLPRAVLGAVDKMLEREAAKRPSAAAAAKMLEEARG